MADQTENPILVAVATTIADGLPVDWETVIAEHPEIEEDLQLLRLLQKVPGAGKRAGEKTPQQKR